MRRYFYIITLSILIGNMAVAAASEQSAEEFQKVCAEKAVAAQAANTITVVGQDGWLFLSHELRHVSVGEFHGDIAQKVSKATKPEWRDPIPAILDFKAGLEKIGVELLVVPVPPKVVVYPDMLDDNFKAKEGEQVPRLDPAHQQFYKLLQEKGVAVLDLYPAFAAARCDGKGDLYCRQDSHWSGRGCEITAEQIAQVIEVRPWLKAAKKQTFSSKVREIEMDGDLRNAVEGAELPKEKIPLCFVNTNEGGSLQPVEPDNSSPVILMGDSHTLVFQAGGDMHARGAGLADQLAKELGFAVDLIGVRGSGASPTRITLFRRGRSDADYFKNKTLLIWCFSAREFTEAASGWRIVPVVKPAN